MIDSLIIEQIGTPSHIEEIVGKGKVNKVYKVTISDLDYILRISEDMPAKTFDMETWCIQQAQRVNIPSALGIKIGKAGKYNYMLYQYVEGKDGNDSLMDKNVLREKLGQYAKKCHSFSFEDLQENGCMDSGIGIQNYKERIQYNISSLGTQDQLRTLGVLDESSSDIVERIFLELLEDEYDIGLTHGDLSLKNLIVGEENTVTLIDRGSARISVTPWYDFAEIMGCHIEANGIGYPTYEDVITFFKGYGISDKEIPNILKETAKWVIIVCFDNLRRAIDNKQDRVERYARRAKQRLECCLKMIYHPSL